jgi:Zn-dependent protease
VNSGVPLGRVFGTEIRAHWTWIFLLALITVVFGEELAVQTNVGFDALWGWGTAIAAAALIFASVTFHELAHVWIARRNGIGGNVVVIQMLGGSYVMEVRPRAWGQELRVALAGPVVSLVLMTVFGVFVGLVELGWGSSNDVPPAVAAVSFVAQVLALFNFFLAVVNLIPGYPMDGARIVHSLAWARSGRDDVGTTVASRVGRMVGFGIMALGAVVVAVVDLWPGLALMIAGWLFVGSSRILERRLMLQKLIVGAHVSDALDSEPARVPPQLTLDVFAGEYMGERLGGAALVERGQELLGLIGTAQIRRIPRRNWPLTRTEQAMVPLTKVPWTSGDTDLWSALETLERSGLDGLLVGTGEHVSALVTRRSAAQLIHERAEQQARTLGPLLQARRFPGRRTPLAPPSAPRPPAPPVGPVPPAGPEGSDDHTSDDTDDQ